MYQFLTADLHINHKNIIEMCDRPFKSTQEMNTKLINNINEQCKPEDIIFNLGDFKFEKSSQAEICTPDPEAEINAKMVHIKGNHDPNNRTKGMLDFAILTFAGTRYLLCHVPPPTKNIKYNAVDHFVPYIDCILCGHVHNNWKFKTYEKHVTRNIVMDPIPVINVGVDVWNYRPIRIDKIHRLYRQIMKKEESR